MLKIERIDGLRIDNGVQYTPTPQGAAFAHVGEWLLFADAAEIENGIPLNRAKYGGKVPPRTGYAANTGALGGNAAFLSTTEKQTQLIPATSDLPIGMPEWTVSFIAKLSDEVPTIRRSVLRSRANPETVANSVGLNLFFDAAGQRFAVGRIGGTNYEATLCSYTPVNTFVNRTVHLVVTHSNVGGLNIYENGLLVANNSTELRDITQPDEDYSIGSGYRGHLSEILINKRDLSRIPGGVSSIANYYKSKYGIL